MTRLHRPGMLAGIGLVAISCSPAARLQLAPDPAYETTQAIRLDRGGVLHGQARPFQSLGAPFRVAVQLLRDDSTKTVVAAVMSDDEGRFRLTGVSAGRFTLVVRGIGYRPAEYGIVAGDSGARAIDAGLNPEPFALDEICAGTCPVQQRGVIRGSVVCAEPAGVVPPELRLALSDSAHRSLRAVTSPQASGSFEFPGIPLGAWRLEVSQRSKVISVVHLRSVDDTPRVPPVLLRCRRE